MFSFDNTYARLPDRFYSRVSPAKVRAPRIVKVNRALAELLGLDPAELDSPAGADVLAGNTIPEGAEPLALAYAGHQFGGFVPQLGDGRAILLGEIVGTDGRRRDVQLKGSGRTPYSRGGDGRAALGPVLREYIVSEAMAALGIPTTRTLAAVLTGELVPRETVQPGGVLTRIAASHMRIGTFEYFAAREDREALATLAAYALARHYPEARGSGNDARALLRCVIHAQASLVAEWLRVGFIHGVMNTDNTTISGETIDYGPCAFLDEFEPRKKFSSIDTGGRYAFGNQPRIMLWNLARLAEALLPLLAEDEAEAVRVAEDELGAYGPAFDAAYAQVLQAKLGLDTDDRELAADLFERMAANDVDHTLFFRRLCASAISPAADAETAVLFADPGAFHDWAVRWRAQVPPDIDANRRAAAMRRVNPAFIPRNHRIEELITRAVAHDDFVDFEKMLDVVARPYEDRADRPDLARYADPPAPAERVQATFCGT